MSQEVHCFHELFLRGSAAVVVFPRDLIQSCNVIFLASFKKHKWMSVGFTGAEIHSFAYQRLLDCGPSLSFPQSDLCLTNRFQSMICV